MHGEEHVGFPKSPQMQGRCHCEFERGDKTNNEHILKHTMPYNTCIYILNKIHTERRIVAALFSTLVKKQGRQHPLAVSRSRRAFRVPMTVLGREWREDRETEKEREREGERERGARDNLPLTAGHVNSRRGRHQNRIETN